MKQNLRDGIGFTFYSDGRTHQGQYRQDREEGQGEWFDKQSQPKNPMNIDYYQWEITKDRVYKVCQKIKPVLKDEQIPTVIKRIRISEQSKCNA